MKDKLKEIVKDIHLKEMLKKQHDFITDNNLSGEEPLGVDNLISHEGERIPKDKNNFIDFSKIL